MTEIIRAAAQLQSLCESEGWRFCFIGGLAVLRWGEPRETVDVDLTLLTGFGGEGPFIKTLLTQFTPRIDNAAEFALTRRVLLLRAGSGVGLDIALGGLPASEATWTGVMSADSSSRWSSLRVRRSSLTSWSEDGSIANANQLPAARPGLN